MFLVRQRTVTRNRIHAYLTAENLRCPELDLYSKAGQAWLATVDLPPVFRGQVGLVLANHARRPLMWSMRPRQLHGSSKGRALNFRYAALLAWPTRRLLWRWISRADGIDFRA